MKVLIIGSGGREHALTWKMTHDPEVDCVFVAPGNPGTAKEKNVKNVAIGATDIEGLINFARKEKIDLTVVGPEAPLVAGIVDCFEQAGLCIFGPNREASRLEGSKIFSKAFMRRHDIPTADYEYFSQASEAKAFICKQSVPIVIKAEGLAAGKGVVVAKTQEEAFLAVDKLLLDYSNEMKRRIIIEDFLEGEEVSFIVMTDGTNIIPLATSQDHKARDNHNIGPNTGGMGAYSPAPILSSPLCKQIIQDIIKPTLAGLAAENIPYKGFLYAGLVIEKNGQARVLEYNCRLGDPETQPMLMRMQSSFTQLCFLGATGNLKNAKVQWDKRVALGVVMTAEGYPVCYQTGDVITGLKDNETNTETIKIFQAGTSQVDDMLLTKGGRVLCVTALAETFKEAQTAAYNKVKEITWRGVYYRTDIGFSAVAHECTKAHS